MVFVIHVVLFIFKAKNVISFVACFNHMVCLYSIEKSKEDAEVDLFVLFSSLTPLSTTLLFWTG